MALKKAIKTEIPILTEISESAFHSDVFVGGDENDGPPGYDSNRWHSEMWQRGCLFTYEKEKEIIGGAVLLKNGKCLHISRIFISPDYFRQGLGQALLKEIEQYFPDIKKINLDTPVWNMRTNNLYIKCGYTESGRTDEIVSYEKII